jgi:tRNA (adenine57-N1/adenine58-N1)-methyltransferase catalytic subunit
VSSPFEPGERALLIDQRGRRYLFRLSPGEVWHSHGGALPHDLIIGSDEGVRVHSASGMSFVCFRPTLADFVLKMPRGAQVVYPKDIGAILVEADVYPGARVLEAGTGSGALTIALARAVGPEGRVVSYEVRSDFHEKAVRNVEAFFGKIPGHVDLREDDVREVAATGERFDRVALDLPEPGFVVDAVAPVLDPGTIVCAYVPTTIQIQQVVQALRDAGFEQVETFEVMRRGWHVGERSVRPDHRMVAHTGFITVGRRTSGPVSPEPG